MPDCSRWLHARPGAERPSPPAGAQHLQRAPVPSSSALCIHQQPAATEGACKGDGAPLVRPVVKQGTAAKCCSLEGSREALHPVTVGTDEAPRAAILGTAKLTETEPRLTWCGAARGGLHGVTSNGAFQAIFLTSHVSAVSSRHTSFPNYSVLHKLYLTMLAFICYHLVDHLASLVSLQTRALADLNNSIICKCSTSVIVPFHTSLISMPGSKSPQVEISGHPTVNLLP